MRRFGTGLLAIAIALLPLLARAQDATPAAPGLLQAAEPAPAIENGSKVSLEYILRDDAGLVLDSNKGRDPFIFIQGDQQIVPGLEKALTGLHAGDEKQVVVAPADGYGTLDPTALAEVPKGMIPAEALQVGTELVARNPEGGSRLVRIKEITDETVIIDLNHPLAGKTLHFDVKVMGVEPPGKAQ